MSADSDNLRSNFADQLASFDDRLATKADDLQMLADIQEGIGRLLEVSGDNEAEIRRTLQERYEAGQLRKETFQLVKSMLDGFVTERSECDDFCGDGIRTRFEFCDDGTAENTGEYGQCNETCTALGPHCGDGIVQPEVEECDDGENLGGSGGCNPDCSSGPFCGDGVRQPELGESCDAGEQNGVPGSGCSEDCEVVVE